MTMIPLPPELEHAVREAAAQHGVSDVAFVIGAVHHELSRLKALQIMDEARAAAAMDDEEAADFAVDLVRRVRRERSAA
jgi:hypothetical protein